MINLGQDYSEWMVQDKKNKIAEEQRMILEACDFPVAALQQQLSGGDKIQFARTRKTRAVYSHKGPKTND